MGNASAATDKQFLKQHNITTILNVTPYNYQYPENITNLNIYQLKIFDANDNETQMYMHDAFDYLVDLIYDDCFDLNKGNVIVHCRAGAQRSPTVVCAYLMKFHHWNMEHAVNYVQSKRPIAYRFYNNFDFCLKMYENKLTGCAMEP